jgi:hypothetical protein
MDDIEMIKLAWENSPQHLAEIEELLSELEWKYAKYKELLRMYKMICGVINRSEENALSAANVTSLWPNVFDRMIEAYECFREEKKLIEDMANNKFSSKSQQLIHEKLKEKFPLKDEEQLHSMCNSA